MKRFRLLTPATLSEYYRGVWIWRNNTTGVPLKMLPKMKSSSLRRVGNRKKRRPDPERNTVKHPTGMPLTLSSVPKVEEARGYWGDWQPQLPVPCWFTVGAQHDQIASEASRGGGVPIIHLSPRSFKLLHYLFVYSSYSGRRNIWLARQTFLLIIQPA